MKTILTSLLVYLSISSYSQVIQGAQDPSKSGNVQSTAQSNGQSTFLQSTPSQASGQTANTTSANEKVQTEPLNEEQLKTKIKVLKQQLKNKRLETDIKEVEKEVLLAGTVDELQADETRIYNANVVTTNFSIPLARFNFTDTSQDKTKKGDILLFNSIGAGVSWNWGVYEATTNGKKKIVKEEFSNIIGGQIGFLFSAGTGKDNNEDNKNVFAPVVNLVLLDFQVGLGYELGSVLPNQKRTFLTLSYAIPLYKLSKTGFYIIDKRYKKSIASDTDEKLLAEKAKADEIIKANKEEKELLDKKIADIEREKTEAQASAKKFKEESDGFKGMLESGNKLIEQYKEELKNAKTDGERKAVEAKIAKDEMALKDVEIKMLRANESERKATEQATAKQEAEQKAKNESLDVQSKIDEANKNKILIDNKTINKTGGFLNN